MRPTRACIRTSESGREARTIGRVRSPHAIERSPAGVSSPRARAREELARPDPGRVSALGRGREESLGDLDPVQGRALSEVVTAREQQQPIRVVTGGSDPPDEDLVAPPRPAWSRGDAGLRGVSPPGAG